MALIEAEKEARYNCWQEILSKCGKCGATKDTTKISLYYKDGAKCLAQSVWNWRVETQRQKTVGLCKPCAPTKEESALKKAQYLGVSATPTPIPSIYDEEGAKLAWFQDRIIKLGHEILEVFGEPIPVVDMITRLKNSRETLRQWQSKRP